MFCFFCKDKCKCKVYKNRKENNNKSLPDKSNSNEMTFLPLTPLDEVSDEKCNTYHKALKYALEKESIHNIAISGNYGSGKSTVIDTYFGKECIKKVLKISLATFLIEKKDSKEDKNELKALPNTTIQEIENSILQQMIYRKGPDKFPFSRFKRIKSYKWYEKLGIDFCVLATIVLILAIVKPNIDIFSKISNLFKNLFEPEYYPRKLLVILSVIGTIVSSSFLISRVLKIRLTKFAFQKIEFGLDDIKNESLLNKYLDEILYFFEITKIDTVVFEDLDRFKMPEIFFNLRELNLFLNNYEKIKNKVVFIYAIRDEVFADKSDRTKFFDFIIPIVPVLDSHNSRDILLEKQTEIPSLRMVDKNFLMDVSKYIDDLRLLLNCINEFQI